MTKEELINEYVEAHAENRWMDASDLRALLTEFANRLRPSLPSELDEASEKNFETMEVLEHENIFEETHRKIFKAGAEWMAGQGDTVEGVFKAGDPGYPDVRMGEQYSIEHILCKPGGIEPGDEVVVQFRKK